MNKIRQDIIDKTIESMLEDEVVLEAITESYSPVELYGEKLIAEAAADAFTPDDVFDDQELTIWFLENKNVSEYYDWDEAMHHLADNYTPEDLWDANWLQSWVQDEYGDAIITNFLDNTPVGDAYSEMELLDWMDNYLRKNNLRITVSD